MAYTEHDWTAITPASTKAGLQAMDAEIKASSDLLDAETAAGRALTQGANAVAQKTTLGLENVTNTSDANKPVSTAQQTALDLKVDKVTGYALSKNDLTDALKTKLDGIEAGAQVANASRLSTTAAGEAEVTATPAHWWVLVNGALKRMTQAGWTALVLVATGKTNAATGFTLAGGTTSKTLTVDTDATISTLTASQLAAAIEGGTATTTPNDTDIVPGVKADHSRLYYTWANIFATIWTRLGGLIAGGTAKNTPLDNDEFPFQSNADTNATRKVSWANIKSVLATAFKHGGSNEIGQASAGANVIVKSDANSQVVAFIPAASTTVAGKMAVETAAEIVAGTDETKAATAKYLKAAADLANFYLTKRTKMSDGATALDSQDAFATNYDFTITGDGTGTVSVAATPGAIRYTKGAGTGLGIRRSTTATNSKTVVFRYRTSSLATGNLCPCGYSYNTAHGSFAPSTDWAVGIAQIRSYFAGGSDLSFVGFTFIAAAQNDWFEIDWYWVGDYSYLPGSLSEEAARIADETGDAPGVGSYATQTITATDLATAGKGDTIGGKKYTFVAALTASPGVEGEILKDATKEAELENENLAISEVSRTNNGVKYWAAAVNPLVSSARVNEVLTLTAKTKNGPENDITVVCESGTNHTAGGATLVGGCPDAGVKYSKLVAMGSQGLTAKTSLVAGDYLTLLDSVVGFLKKKILVSNFFAADGGTGAFTAVQGNDTRLVSGKTTLTIVPKFGGVADDGTYVVTIANYVKIRDKISGDLRITWSAKGSKTGSFTFDGIPYAPQVADATPRGLAVLDACSGLANGMAMILIFSGVSGAYIARQEPTGCNNCLTDANFTNTTKLYVHFEYIKA